MSHIPFREEPWERHARHAWLERTWTGVEAEALRRGFGELLQVELVGQQLRYRFQSKAGITRQIVRFAPPELFAPATPQEEHERATHAALAVGE